MIIYSILCEKEHCQRLWQIAWHVCLSSSSNSIQFELSSLLNTMDIKAVTEQCWALVPTCWCHLELSTNLREVSQCPTAAFTIKTLNRGLKTVLYVSGLAVWLAKILKAIAVGATKGFQQKEGPNRNLLRALWNFAKVRWHEMWDMMVRCWGCRHRSRMARAHLSTARPPRPRISV